MSCGDTVPCFGAEDVLRAAYQEISDAITSDARSVVEVVGFTNTADRGEQRTTIDSASLAMVSLTRVA